MTATSERASHWDRVYEKLAESVSWFQPEARLSLELITAAGISEEQAIVDVGGGASTLVDGLLERGYADISVLDITDKALEVARRRLGPASAAVRWITADITTWVPSRRYRCWHDRAVFHFLTDSVQRQAYRACLARAVEAGGSFIVATFAEDGPERCSGLLVQRYSLEELQAEFRELGVLIESRRQRHQTPSGAEQSFIFARFAR